MQYPITLILIFISIFSFFLFINLLKYIRHKLLLKKLKSVNFPNKYKKILFEIPLYNFLNEMDKRKIEYLILVFINEKEFIGIYDLRINNRIKITISFYACLLILHKDNIDYYQNLSTILVYPYEFIVEEKMSYNDIYSSHLSVLEGQSTIDTVIISWHNAKKEAYHLSKNSVLLHEFAHQIDFFDGIADGIPFMREDKYSEWIKVIYSEYDKLKNRNVKGRYFGKYNFIGEYASTNKAEFFAVITERFFEKPKILKRKFPDIYEELKKFYEIDPIKDFNEK
jgi:Mlc titration factor MtfA (ptsG expression regulator)